MLYLTFFISFLFSAAPSLQIIDGYSSRMSAFPGDSIALYLNSNLASNYNLKLYDLSGKEVSNFRMHVFPQTPLGPKAYEQGFCYRQTRKVMVPHLPSGVYMWDNQIPFIIKSKSADVTVVYSSNTINAYANTGGKSLYGFNSTDNMGAQKVSFLRPLPLPRHSEAFLRWIQKGNAWNIGYISDLDLDDFNSIKRSKLVIIPGHSEYWTIRARKNFDRFVHDGNDALILSGNTMWWQVRYNKTRDQLICYRDAKKDPIKSPRLKTITWCEATLQYPIFNSIGTDFRNAGYGLKEDKGWNGYKIVRNSPLLAGSSVGPGDILVCPSDELDGTPVLGFDNGIPIIDNQSFPFQKVQIVGYDMVSRAGKDGVATWIVFKPGNSSGTIINTASTDWCSSRGIGNNVDIQKITHTMINKLLNKENVFSTEEEMPGIVN